MTTAPAYATLDPRAKDARSERASPMAASVYFWLVVVAAAASVLAVIGRFGPHTHGWVTFAVLGTAIAVSQIFVVATPKNQAYHTTVVFLVAAALLLPPELVALIAVVQHVPDWLKRRLAFQIQTFNIADWTLSAMAVWLTFDSIERWQPFGAGGATSALAGATSCIVFVAVNHGLLAPMLRFARGHTLRESKLFSAENVSTDLVLAALGVGVAMLWRTDPWLVPFAIAPLLLIHRSLAVPTLEAEARVDPKTGLFNARHFAEALRDELARSARTGREMTVIMADLDLLRDINNTYGHLAGDAVLAAVAQVFSQHLRHYDTAARFGGEEFSFLLPETTAEEALLIAERIRRAVATLGIEVSTSEDPVRATLSLGVASYPRDGSDANELVHQADLAVYRAKLQGRNRVVDASQDSLLVQVDERARRLVALPDVPEEPVRLPARLEPLPVATERRRQRRPHAHSGPRFLLVGGRLAVLVGLVGVAGTGLGVAALFAGPLRVSALVGVLALVGVGQALSIEVDRMGSISVSAVGALAGAAIVGPRAALPLAITIAIVEWSARRTPFHKFLFNVGALTLASLSAAAVFEIHVLGGSGTASIAADVGLGVLAGAAYYMVNTGLIAAAVAVEGGDSVGRIWREQFGWLVTHYVVYGFIGAMIADAFAAIGVWALVVFAVPLFLLRETQGAYVRSTQRSAKRLREAAETIQSQNISLESANRMLKERSAATMESLSATVDARDAYTAGHSRRVQELALGAGRALDLSHTELEVLAQAALLHDIGKVAVPDAVLLKPGCLTDAEWTVMRRHAEEGAAIIDRLGFLSDAVPSIRHHHERFDGRGYPVGLVGEEIPLGARIIHVADAFDSMLSNRVYRPARPLEDALAELHEQAGAQFCPRCVAALEQFVVREDFASVYDAVRLTVVLSA